MRRREALKKKETSQDDLEPDPARERIQNLKGLLAKLDAAVDLLQGGARDPEDDAAPRRSGLKLGFVRSLPSFHNFQAQQLGRGSSLEADDQVGLSLA